MVPTIFFTFRVCCNKLNIISVLSVNKCKIIFLAFYRWTTSAVDRQRLELVDRADYELFQKVHSWTLGNPHHVLRSALPRETVSVYGLRHTRHNRELINKINLVICFSSISLFGCFIKTFINYHITSQYQHYILLSSM